MNACSIPNNTRSAMKECSKGEISESSFGSWASYRRALKETRSRLKDRVTSRSQPCIETNDMRARSGNEMRRSLSWWDLVLFGLGTIIGAAVFVLTGLEAHSVTGPSVILSFAFSGLTAMLSVLCYAEFAVEIPVAGGSFAYLRVELGDFTAFIAGGNLLFDTVIACAAIARSWTSYFATLMNLNPNDLRIHVASFSRDYSHLDPIAVAVIAIVGVITILSIKCTSRLNNIASIIHIFIILLIIVAGLAHSNPKNLSPFTPFGLRGIFSSSAVLFFAYTGFDAVATMAEETKNPAKDVPVGLVVSMLIATLIYCLLALTLCLMQPYYQLDPDAPFAVAFGRLGMGWAKYIVALGAIEGMTTSLLASVVGMARYMTHIARTGMVPLRLAYVNKKTGTPVNATLLMVVVSSIVGFFTSLSVLSNFFSISVLSIFTLVAVAILVRRYYVSGETTKSDRNKFILFLVMIMASSIAMAIYWAIGRDGNGNGHSLVGYMVILLVWFLSTLGLWRLVPKARKPKKWGVPMVPWLPSASIGMNMFLMGSIDSKSFVRFGVWTVGLLVYYLLWGLHSSYDLAKLAPTTSVIAGESEKMEVEDGIQVIAYLGE